MNTTFKPNSKGEPSAARNKNRLFGFFLRPEPYLYLTSTQLKLHIVNPQMFIGQTLNFEVAFFDQDPKSVGNYLVKHYK